MSLALVTRILAKTIEARSPRGLVRAIAEALAAELAVIRVELRHPAPFAIAELVAGDWRIVEGTPSERARVLAPGLAVVTKGAVPAAYADPALREAIGQIVAAAARHIEVLGRVAAVSQRAHVENRALREDLQRGGPSALVARSPAMQETLARAVLVARHATTVLLTGESGSGKEVVAREIHRRSPRAHRPFLQLNCGALPAGLVESELFGHERGAFTGAERAHVGVFERAHRGTLLLDEIGDLPATAQVKLLRVLQERQIRRVGGEAQLDVDVRLIAATHRPLRELVDAGAFREDLYYRLDVFSLRVPPLRERREDLAPLVADLVHELAAQLGMAPPPIPRALLARIAAHDWPGNVRELRNALETAMILGGGEALALPDGLSRRRAPAAADFDGGVRRLIEDALRAARGKLYGPGGAAEILRLDPGTLQSKMRKLGIERAAFVRRAG